MGLVRVEPWAVRGRFSMLVNWLMPGRRVCYLRSMSLRQTYGFYFLLTLVLLKNVFSKFFGPSLLTTTDTGELLLLFATNICNLVSDCE